MAVINNLHVIKLGSSTIGKSETIFAEIAALSKQGAKILLISGGADAIERKFADLQKEVQFLTLDNGDQVRYCPPEAMNTIRQAYAEYIFEPVQQQLQAYGLSVLTQCAGDHGWVQGKQGKPLKVRKGDKKVIVRDSLYGSYGSANQQLLTQLLHTYDVVCLSPPIYDPEIGQYINIDADMLAAHLAIALEASHLRFVTSTAGILSDIANPSSTIRDIYPQAEQIVVTGRMKQKLRAAELALDQGIADIAITGPHTLYGAGKTWFWRGQHIPPDIELLHQAISIPSVSKDEAVLAQFLQERVSSAEINAEIDPAGNIVLTKGSGEHTLLLLGHIDTVPYVWQSAVHEQRISGRGSVDAKGSLINFVEVLRTIDVPDHARLVVIGAVEEEVSSSAGAFYVRDHVQADAVIIGEPSGTHNLTLGYYGLLKLKLHVVQKQQHSAGKDSVSSIDKVYQLATHLREIIAQYDPDHLSAIVDIEAENSGGHYSASATLNFRISPQARAGYIEDIHSLEWADSTVEILRNTPGYQNSRKDLLVKSFVRGSSTALAEKLTFLMKKGTSDMNTLATTWTDIPMVAFGPGDASLDHTDQEFLDIEEVRLSRKVLRQSIETWFSLISSKSKENVYALNTEQVT